MEDFESQAQMFAEEIEDELADGRLNFPTSLDVSMRIKRLADDPRSSLDQIANVVKAEPVLSAKAVRMANAVALNPYGIQVTSVKEAVIRIGLSAVRCLAFAVAAEQLAQDHRSRTMRKIAAQLWEHTIDVASWSYAFARHLRVVNADTALFGGMMVDIGQFFLLARASSYPDLEKDMGRFAHIVETWNRRIAISVLNALELPDSVVAALQQDNYRPNWPPVDLRDVLFLARVASDAPPPFDQYLVDPLDRQGSREQLEGLPELMATVQEMQKDMARAIRG